MGANKPNKHALSTLVNRHNQPVFVPTYIKHRPIVGQNVRTAEHLFEINRRSSTPFSASEASRIPDDGIVSEALVLSTRLQWTC
jgi:hypothetical protein